MLLFHHWQEGSSSHYVLLLQQICCFMDTQFASLITAASGAPSDAAQSIVRELLHPYLEECALEGVLERFSVACNLQRLLSGGFRFVIEAGEGGLAVKQDVFRRVASHFKKHGVPPRTVVLCSAKVVLCSDEPFAQTVGRGTTAPGHSA